MRRTNNNTPTKHQFCEINDSPSPSLKSSLECSPPNFVYKLYKDSFIQTKLELDKNIIYQYSTQYLLCLRPHVVQILSKMNNTLCLSDHCFELAIRIIDRFSPYLELEKNKKFLEMISLASILISSKLVTDTWIPISTVSLMFGLQQTKLVQMQSFILQKLDFNVLIPTVLDYYEALYGQKPSSLLKKVCGCSSLVEFNKLHLAMALRKLEDKKEAYGMIFGQQHRKIDVQDDIKNFMLQISSSGNSKI